MKDIFHCITVRLSIKNDILRIFDDNSGLAIYHDSIGDIISARD